MIKKKIFKTIEVPARVEEGLALCQSKKGEFCYYFDWSFCCCESIDKFQNCSNKKIVYLKV